MDEINTNEGGDSKTFNNASVEYATHGGKVQCPFCSVPIGDLFVTSHRVMIQDKFTATTADCRPMLNINFKGQCLAVPAMVPPPCMAVIRLGQWQNFAPKVKVSGNNALHAGSVIPCMAGGSTIRIADSGQKKKNNKSSLLAKNPKVVKVEFLDENDVVLTPSARSALGDITCSDIMYGQKVKIRITTADMDDGAQASFRLRGESKSAGNFFAGINELRWDLTINGNQCETDLFRIPIFWYNDDQEKYNYNSGKYLTEVESDNLNNFYVSGWCDSVSFNLPDKAERLIPYSYKRNYEELIGLFDTDDSGNKSLKSNYENKFISSDSNIRTIVNKFIDFICEDKDLTMDDIKAEVKTQAKALWNAAVGASDDRPLYWGRNKMQVYLKRHPVFKPDLDLNKSIVKKDTNIDKIIILFEELSRNYTGIDFSAAGGNKKVLVTGFDPFLLNSIDHPDKNRYNILQSNPSGCVALSLHKQTIGNGYIQTMIVPVRYTDFDGSQDPKDGQGEGIIEKYIKPFILEVDMIVTISQAGPDDYNIDKYATLTRGGYYENMNYTRAVDSSSVPSGDEWIGTTLPSEFLNTPDVKYNWDYDGVNGNITPPTPGVKMFEGPGGNYLSNEIFYRVARLRKAIKPALPTGHFHISKLQDSSKREDFSNGKTNTMLSIVKAGLEEGIKGLK